MRGIISEDSGTELGPGDLPEVTFDCDQARSRASWPYGAALACDALWGPLLGGPGDADCEDLNFHDGH